MSFVLVSFIKQNTRITFTFFPKLLHELISQAEAQSSRGSDSSALKQAAKKWRRLQEELEDEMLKAQTTGTTFQKKRRVDVTLSMNELVQRQRRRLNPNEIVSGSALNGNDSSKTALENSLDSSIASFLTKCSLGNPVDKESVECIFRYAYGGSTDSKCMQLYELDIRVLIVYHDFKFRPQGLVTY